MQKNETSNYPVVLFIFIHYPSQRANIRNTPMPHENPVTVIQKSSRKSIMASYRLSYSATVVDNPDCSNVE